MPAQQAHHEVHAEDQEHTQRQHPQRVGGIVGNHAVVHVHRKNRHDQGEDIDQQGGANHIAIHRALFKQCAPEPVTLHDFADFGRTRVEGEARPGKQGDAQVAFGQLVTGKRDLALPGFWKQQLRRIAGFVPAKQHTGLIALEQQDDRQQNTVDPCQRTAHDLAGQTGTRCGAGKKRGRQTTAFERQTG